MPTNHEKIVDKIVWVSRAKKDSTLMRGAKICNPLPPDASNYPKELFYKYIGEYQLAQPDIFRAGGILTVSAAFADVLRQFNFWSTRLYPVRLLQNDRKTPIDGDSLQLSGAQYYNAHGRV